MKVKLEYLDGCNYSSTCDGVELVDLTDVEIEKKLKPALCKMINDLDRSNECFGYILSEIFEKLLINTGKYEVLGDCEQCGESDELYTKTVHIDTAELSE